MYYINILLLYNTEYKFLVIFTKKLQGSTYKIFVNFTWCLQGNTGKFL